MGLLDRAMDAYISVNGVDSPDQVSNAYQQLQQSLKSDDIKRKDAFDEKVADFSVRTGADIMQAPEYKDQSTPLERWKRQIDGMMKSGNKTLQAEGLRQMSQYQQRATSTTGASTPSTAAKMAVEMDLAPGTKPYKDFIKRYALKDEIVSERGSNYLTPEEKVQGGFDAESPMVWNDKGIPVHVKSSSFTEAQQKSAGFADRMAGAESQLAALHSGTDYDASNWNEAIAEMVPGGVGGSYIMNNKQQVAKQAQDDWIRAVLRQQSGAVIADEEMARERSTYFAKPGDGPAVKQAKKYARERVGRAMRESAGGSYEMTDERMEQYRKQSREVVEIARKADRESWEKSIVDDYKERGIRARFVDGDLEIWED